MSEYGMITHPEDFDEILNRMTNEEAGILYKNMVRAFIGEEVEHSEDRYLDVMITKLCGRVEREKEISLKRSISGAVGGRASKPKAKAKQKVSKTKANEKQTVSSNIPITNNQLPIKDIYGEAKNVFLTAEEYEKIKSKGLTELIEELSLYMASKKKTYADHYMTILAWGRRREKENKVEPLSGTNAKNQFNRFNQRTDYDFAALEKKLIKN